MQAQPYWPNLTYSAKRELAPGVEYYTATQNTSPSQRIFIFEIDLTNKNIELRPVFKGVGNVSGSNERTSLMAERSDGIAAINAGYYSTSTTRTNSYTEIDGIYVGGAADHATNLAENGRSIVGFSGAHQSTAMRTKMTGSTAMPNPLNATTEATWDLITDAIAGRGHFTWDGNTYTMDSEGTTTSHYDARHNRSAIGYTHTNGVPEKVFLVAVDGRATIAQGMTYDELARFMADLGAEQSISLDGGGSTTAWIKDEGVKNVPSDGSERSVISAWVVVRQNTMDNTVSEVTSTGAWTADAAATDKYHVDHLVTDNSAGASTVTWTPELDEAGEYRVFAWWSADAGRATAAPYEITHRGGTSVVEVDQTQNGGKWNLLGNYAFDAGTAGTVSLSNGATGSIYADAVRFVRYRDIPGAFDTEYDVLGTVFETDFESDQSSNFTIAQQSTGDNSVNFNYDHTTFAQVGGGFPQSIPAAPNSDPGETTALRVATNVSAGAANGITATVNSAGIPAGLTNFRMTVDAWINYNGGINGGSGSTEFMSFGASANDSMVASANSSYTAAATSNSPFSGFYFAISGEGGASADYRYYDGNGGNANGSNASRVNYLGSAATESTSFGSVFPLGAPYETNGIPGKAWHTWEIIALDGRVRLSVIKPDGTQTILADWFTPNAGTTLSDLRPHLGTFDPYASLANPASDNFVLYDNLKIESIQEAAPTNATGWHQFQ